MLGGDIIAVGICGHDGRALTEDEEVEAPIGAVSLVNEGGGSTPGWLALAKGGDQRTGRALNLIRTPSLPSPARRRDRVRPQESVLSPISPSPISVASHAIRSRGSAVHEEVAVSSRSAGRERRRSVALEEKSPDR